jgi:predicted RNA binding protein YcfA (HicA-like mRNA interferase family)
VKKRKLERYLAAHGCRLAREAAKHELWENPATGQRSTVPRRREIKMTTARGICRQLGCPLPPAGNPNADTKKVSRNMSQAGQI